MYSITFDPEFARLCPQFSLVAIQAMVQNSPSHEELVRDMNDLCHGIEERLEYESIKSIPAIYHTRQAYKTLGKDPNRYRPASEQLMRRVVSGKGLYYIDTLVDIGNWISLRTGFSIGVIDADKISGDILLRKGGAQDPYEGIGRGSINIEGLPCYFDSQGAFATPTSDSERTKISLETRNVLILINNYIPRDQEITSLGTPVQSVIEFATELTLEALQRYASAQQIEVRKFVQE